MKLFKTDDSQGSIKSSALNTMFEWLIQGLGEERHKFTVAGNHGYKETDNMNSVQSSLKFHPVQVTL